MNLIGEGKFGEVYKGLLQHGILVAIKKRRGLASQEFFHEVIRMNNVLIAGDEFQVGSNGMLDDWEENLAVITANRTKGDELVIIHLVDEANFESYSDSARLYLIGANHWKCPRTYASPEAIQRTELYEYSKVVGNSQFTLHPFQPYKLIYAFMLAEVGKVSDSLKYCQALLKSLKTGCAGKPRIVEAISSIS
ncbi:hypothetical protein JHK85_000783 [Glycine max]|nr:hypothetical protein JHK87_000767 [Glycine soja]KAG5068406.1 hypothetical protein JHK85_000783 [Glycine max]